MSLITKVTHDDTLSSKKNRAVEAALTERLNGIVNKIKSKINPQYAWSELSSIYRPLYDPLVSDTIRAAVTESYLIGAEFAGGTISAGIPIFLTESDTATIKQISADGTEQFWGRMTIATSRGADKVFFNIRRDQTPPDSFLNPNYVVNAIAISITNITLNIATVKKRRDLVHRYEISLRDAATAIATTAATAASAKNTNINTKVDVSTAPFISRRTGGIVASPRRLLSQSAATTAIPTPKEIDPDVLDVESLENSILLGLDPDTMMLIDDSLTWVTSLDEAVCPECDSIEGQNFVLDDPNMLIPDIDTHPNCRCRLIPLG